MEQEANGEEANKEEIVQFIKQGNVCRKEGKYIEAIEKYGYAISICSQVRCRSERSKALGGISLSYLKLKQPFKALVYAEWSVRMDPSSAKAYSCRAKSNSSMGHVEKSVMDYLKSHELQASQSSLHKAIEISVKHGCISLIKKAEICGIQITKHDLIFLHEKWYSLKEDEHGDDGQAMVLAIQKSKDTLLPFLLLILRLKLNCRDIVQSIELENDMLPKCISSLLQFVHDESHHLHHLEPDLIIAALKQTRFTLASKFLDILDIQRYDICISDLIDTTSLCSQPDVLRKMLEKGAKVSKCKKNPFDLVLQKTLIPSTKLDVITILLSNERGAAINMIFQATTLIHEVVKLTIECKSDNIQALQKVCGVFPSMENKDVVDQEGRTPWYFAITAKRNKTSENICQILFKFPIYPNLTDKKECKGKSSKDKRIILLEKKLKEKDEKKEVTKPEAKTVKEHDTKRKRRKNKRNGEKVNEKYLTFKEQDTKLMQVLMGKTLSVHLMQSCFQMKVLLVSPRQR